MAPRECPVCGFLAFELCHIPFSGENVCFGCFYHFNYRMSDCLTESAVQTDKAPVQ